MKAFCVFAACALFGACASRGGSGAGGTSGGAGTGGAISGGGVGGGAGGSGGSGDDRSFVPTLPISSHDGQPGALTVVALTLVQGAAGPELYLAVRNDGPTPVCETGVMITFNDQAGQELTSAAVGLLTGRYYRLEPDTVLSCIDAGRVAMGASTNLPAEVVIDQLGSLQHRFVFFNLDGIVPIEGLAVSALSTVATAVGRAYRGTLTNGLALTVSNPRVTIFPVNRVGRPLGAATSNATLVVPPAGTWSFETGSVTDTGVDQVAFPGAAIVP
jgi:hypothetical protein